MADYVGIIENKAPLHGAIGHASLAFQEGDDLVEDVVECHGLYPPSSFPYTALPVSPLAAYHTPSCGVCPAPATAAPLRRVRSKLTCETGLEEGVHILRALHNDGLLVLIGKDKEALLLYRLDDNLSDLVGGHQHAMENG